MSLDTVTRVNKYFKDTVADPNSIFTIFEEDNERQSDGNGRGPLIRLFVEPALDTLLNDGSQFLEDGTVIAQIFVDVGESTSDQHRIATLIRDAFRQVKLTATGGEQGDIYFQDIEMANGGQVPKANLRNNTRDKQKWWLRQDVFITYNKYCS